MKIIFIYIFFCFTGCINAPYAYMTNEYIEIAKPGQTVSIVELVNVKIDSIMDYPIEETAVMSFVPIKVTKKKINENARFQINFNKPDNEHMWKVTPDIFFADHYFSQTINIKPNTWYKLYTEKYLYTVYFFGDSLKDVNIIKLKPKPGAW